MTEPPPDEHQDDAKSSIIAAAILGVVLSLGALVFFGVREAGSVAIGALIGVANLLAMRAIIRSILTPPEDGKTTTLWAILAIVKIVILFGGLWLLLTRRVVDPIPLVVGYGVLPLGITASAVWSSLRDQDSED